MAAGLRSHTAHPPPGCFWQGARQSRIKRLRCACVLHVGVPLAPRPARSWASPSPPASPGSCLVLAGSSKPGQAAASRSPQLRPPAPSRISLCHPCSLQDGDPGSQDEVPPHPPAPSSASQTITQAPDQRPTSVEYPFHLHSVSHALIIVLIKAVLILTSPLVPPPSAAVILSYSLLCLPVSQLQIPSSPLSARFSSTSGIPGLTSPVL